LTDRKKAGRPTRISSEIYVEPAGRVQWSLGRDKPASWRRSLPLMVVEQSHSITLKVSDCFDPTSASSDEQPWQKHAGHPRDDRNRMQRSSIRTSKSL
jgi:hypothetical protein